MHAIERFYVAQDWITMIFMSCLIILASAKMLFPQRFEDFISLGNSGKFIVFKGKENKAFHGFNILLFLIQSIAISLFLLIVYQHFTETIRPAWIIFIRIFTAYFCLILIKSGIEKIIGNIFEMDERIDYYLFQKFSYRNFISLFLLGVCLLLVYTIEPTFLILAITGGLLILANTIALFLIYRKNQNVLSANWFYFILYLCALEIAPYIILYKLITN